MKTQYPIPKNLSSNKTPHLVAIIDDYYDIAFLNRLIDRGVALFEYRADLLKGCIDDVLTYLASIRHACAVPVLITLRQTPQNTAHRLSFFKQLCPLGDGMDIEFDSDTCNDLYTIAQEHSVDIVLSVHRFDLTPPDHDLLHLLLSMTLKRPSVIKLALQARTPSDPLRLLTLCQHHASLPFVAISMGEMGASSRIKGAQWGSIWSYGYLKESLAPGQRSIDELISIFC